MKRKLPPAPKPRRSPPLKPPSNLLLAMEGRAMLEWASFALAWPLLESAFLTIHQPVHFGFPYYAVLSAMASASFA